MTLASKPIENRLPLPVETPAVSPKDSKPDPQTPTENQTKEQSARADKTTAPPRTLTAEETEELKSQVEACCQDPEKTKELAALPKKKTDEVLSKMVTSALTLLGLPVVPTGAIFQQILAQIPPETVNRIENEVKSVIQSIAGISPAPLHVEKQLSRRNLERYRSPRALADEYTRHFEGLRGAQPEEVNRVKGALEKDLTILAALDPAAAKEFLDTLLAKDAVHIQHLPELRTKLEKVYASLEDLSRQVSLLKSEIVQFTRDQFRELKAGEVEKWVEEHWSVSIQEFVVENGRVPCAQEWLVPTHKTRKSTARTCCERKGMSAQETEAKLKACDKAWEEQRLDDKILVLADAIDLKVENLVSSLDTFVDLYLFTVDLMQKIAQESYEKQREIDEHRYEILREELRAEILRHAVLAAVRKGRQEHRRALEDHKRSIDFLT